MLSLGAPRGTIISLRGDAVESLSPLSGGSEHLEQFQRQNERSATGTSDSNAADTARPEENTELGAQGLTCGTCRIGVNTSSFGSVEDQRSHFQSDWHRLNVRRRLASKPALSEEDFERLVQQQEEVSSISGSNTSSDEDPVQQVRRQQYNQATAGLSCFRCPDGSILAVWRSLLEPPAQKGRLSQQQLLTNMQMLHKAPGRWAIILSQGGHFAASLFECMPAQQGQQSKKEPPAFSTVDHKTFHRYVIRAKSGGRQSGKDATGKHAKSAGSTIRRHNEAMLKQEIQDLLQAWRPHLAAASLIFVHAPAANAAPIFGAQPKLLDRADARVRSIPFPTRRPTFSETQRAMRMLLTVYCVEEQALPGPAADPPLQSGDRPEEREIVKSAAVEPPDTPDSNAESREEPPVAELVQSELHAAAREGSAARVSELLEAGHDPTAVDSEGKTPYAAAASKPVRDCVRRHMGAHPEQWDWTAAGVPMALTAELEARQAAKQAEKKARQREREKERKRLVAVGKAEQEAQAKAAAEAEIEAAAAQAAAQSARGKAAAAQVNPRASRAEAQAQARRQQLAAAAEARMAALQQAASQQQLW